MPVIPYSSRWRSTVGAHLIEYTAERNELESESSSTTSMENGDAVVLRQISTIYVTLRAQAASAAHRDVNELLS